MSQLPLDHPRLRPRWAGSRGSTEELISLEDSVTGGPHPTKPSTPELDLSTTRLLDRHRMRTESTSVPNPPVRSTNQLSCPGRKLSLGLREAVHDLGQLYRRATLSFHVRHRRRTSESTAVRRPDGVPVDPSFPPWKRSMCLIHRAGSTNGSTSTAPGPVAHSDSLAGSNQDAINAFIASSTSGGGAAARAAAAADNERLNASRVRPATLEGDANTESGIEIDPGESIERSLFTLQSSSSVVRIDPMKYLPSELLIQILSLLDHRSVSNAERVSRTWNALASSNSVWRMVFGRAHPASLASISPSFTPHAAETRPRMSRDWKKIFAAKVALERRWNSGSYRAMHLDGHSDSVYCAQLDEDKLITGSRDKTVRIWDIRTYRCVDIIGGPSSTPSPSEGGRMASRDRSYSADGATPLVSPPMMTMATIIAPDRPPDDSTATSHQRLPIYHTGSILCLQFDDEILVTGSSDSTCIVWSIHHGYRPVRRLQRHAGGVLDLSFDEKHIISSSKDSTLCLWSRTGGDLLKQMRGHLGPVNAVELRGNLAVSTSGDGLIKLWNLDSGKCVKEFGGQFRGLACVQLSQDSRWIISGGNDHIVRLWDVNSGECVREFRGHRGMVRSICLDSRRRRIISGSYDRSVKVFDLDTGTLLIEFAPSTAGLFLSTKTDYRRVVATSDHGRIYLMDFGAHLPDVERLTGIGLV